MKGMKQTKSPSTKERIKELEQGLQVSQMATQMSQQILQQITSQFQTLQADMNNTMGMLNDFQYRTLAMLELGNFKTEDVDSKAEEFKLKDFTKASDKEDELKGYAIADTEIINEDSIVILTSTTPSESDDQGIFRSKFPMSECLTPDLRELILGSKVGDVIEAKLANIDHKITILGLRSVPVEETAETK